jgi:flagellar motor switch protein FliM
MTADDVRAHAGDLLGVVREGGRVREALSRLDADAPALLGSFRRAVPFLSRRATEVVAGTPFSVDAGTLLADVALPAYVLHLATDPGGARAMLIFDGPSLGILLDAALGGKKAAVLDPAGLTEPQRALVSRVARGVLDGFCDVLARSKGLRLVPLPRDAGAGAEDGVHAAITMEINGDVKGIVTLAIARDALAATATRIEPGGVDGIDKRIQATLEDVELDLVAELGRVRMPLGSLGALRVGDTIRLGVPVDGEVVLRADGKTLFSGYPTTAGRQIAVKISTRHAT